MLQTIIGLQHANASVRALISLGRISVFVALLCAGSLVAIPYFANFDNSDYTTGVYSILSAQERLPLLMVFSGLWLIGATAITTWFIALYSSFRVAGPLFRFAKNIEIEYKAETGMTLNIRSSDNFQKDSLNLLASMQKVNSYYDDMYDYSGEILSAMTRYEKGLNDKSEIKNMLEHLDMLVKRANLEKA